MCGISVIFNYKNKLQKVNSKELVMIRDHMRSRGPDDEGLWIKDNIGMGHRRLSVIDPSNNGHQPMVSSCGKVRIVFNGEIYNYKKIKKDLKQKGYSFKTNSDTEVLINLYKDKGESMLNILRGMYAFAIWDEINQGLFIARDPLGIKPLYYSDNGKEIRISSQVKALIAGGGIKTTTDPAGLVGFYLWGSIPEPCTLYKEIRSLEAGTKLWINKKGIRKETYFKLSDLFEKEFDSQENKSKEEAIVELDSALNDSISHHLVSDVPIGVFLSSGIDSTSLVAYANHNRNKISTITLGFNEYKTTNYDEIPLAERVASFYGTRHISARLDRDDCIEEFGKIFSVMDQPSIDGINTYFVSKIASKAGIKVALSGIGADEIFGGYPSFSQIPNIVNFFKFLGGMNFLGRSFRYITTPLFKKIRLPKLPGLIEYSNSYGEAYLLRRGLFMPWELPEILDQQTIRDGWEELQPITKLNDLTKSIVDEHLKVSIMEMSFYMRNQLLRDVDWAGMAHSLEIRTPFVDIDFLKNVIPLLKTNTPPGKKEIGLKINSQIKSDILSRSKSGFNMPVNKWISDRNNTFKVKNNRDFADFLMQHFL